jgi:hypothetical protein
MRGDSMGQQEAIGNFWLPSDPGRRVPGLLTYGPAGSSLTVFGTLRDYGRFNFPEGRTIGLERVEEAVVLGFLVESSELVTLRGVSGDVMGISPLWFVGSQVAESFDVEWVLIGTNTTSSEVAQVRVGFDWLDAWVHAPSLLKTIMGDGRVTFDRADYVMAEGATAARTVRLVAAAEGGNGDAAIHIDRRVWLEISDAVISIDAIQQELVRPLHDLLIVSLGRAVAVTEMRVRVVDDNDRAGWLRVFGSLTQPEAHSAVRPRSARADDSPTLVLPDDDLIPFADLIPRWDEVRARHLGAVVTYCAPFYAPFIYGEHDFATTFQAAESFAKALFGSKELDAGAHAERVEAVIAPAMSSGVSDEITSWARRVLVARNDRSLRMLMIELLRHSGLFEDADCDVLAKRLVSARAGVSHGGAKQASARRQAMLGLLLRWVVRACLVMELGADPEKLRGRVLAKPGFVWVRDEALR